MEDATTGAVVVVLMVGAVGAVAVAVVGRVPFPVLRSFVAGVVTIGCAKTGPVSRWSTLGTYILTNRRLPDFRSAFSASGFLDSFPSVLL